MDISAHISELLYDHDCVIIPGFGGFIGNYKSAVINAEEHTIAPPSKALSFNVNLQTNDGLLVNQIAKKKDLPFDISSTIVEAWVASSNALLASDEEVTMTGIGRIYKDVEGNLQFMPDTSVNYLRSSFGLRTITVVPVVREKNLSLEERKRRLRRRKIFRPGMLRMAATVLIVATIASLSTMLFMGIQVKPLNLDEANVVSFINEIFKTDEHTLRPIPVEEEKIVIAPPADTLPSTPEAMMVTIIDDDNEPAKPVSAVAAPAVVNEGSPSYYIIIGAFRDDNNAAKAKEKLLQRFPEQNIYFEKKNTLTKVGYFAGSSSATAKEQLDSAHNEDASYWLMKK